MIPEHMTIMNIRDWRAALLCILISSFDFKWPEKCNKTIAKIVLICWGNTIQRRNTNAEGMKGKSEINDQISH